MRANPISRMIRRWREYRAWRNDGYDYATGLTRDDRRQIGEAALAEYHASRLSALIREGGNV